MKKLFLLLFIVSNMFNQIKSIDAAYCAESNIIKTCDPSQIIKKMPTEPDKLKALTLSQYYDLYYFDQPMNKIRDHNTGMNAEDGTIFDSNIPYYSVGNMFSISIQFGGERWSYEQPEKICDKKHERLCKWYIYKYLYDSLVSKKIDLNIDYSKFPSVSKLNVKKPATLPKPEDIKSVT